MREIKFRAWAAGKMYYPKSFGIEMDGKRFSFQPDDQGGGTYVTDDFMQFTGLKDKNGKEIYESDIVSLILIEDAGLGHRAATKAVVRWDDDDAGYYYDTEYSKFPHAKPWYTENAEVIGNIYENPDLLK